MTVAILPLLNAYVPVRKYPFPYEDEWFVRTCAAFADAFERGQPDEALLLRHALKPGLTSEDFQVHGVAGVQIGVCPLCRKPALAENCA